MWSGLSASAADGAFEIFNISNWFLFPANKRYHLGQFAVAVGEMGGLYIYIYTCIAYQLSVAFRSSGSVSLNGIANWVEGGLGNRKPANYPVIQPPRTL